MRRVSNDLYIRAVKVAKRIGITILCCIPALIIFAYLTRSFITNDAVQIICFIVIMAVAVIIEELIAKRMSQKREAKKLLRKDNRDVFK